jgi:hypothetical protein
LVTGWCSPSPSAGECSPVESDKKDDWQQADELLTPHPSLQGWALLCVFVCVRVRACSLNGCSVAGCVRLCQRASCALVRSPPSADIVRGMAITRGISEQARRCGVHVAYVMCAAPLAGCGFDDHVRPCHVHQCRAPVEFWQLN